MLCLHSCDLQQLQVDRLLIHGAVRTTSSKDESRLDSMIIADRYLVLYRPHQSAGSPDRAHILPETRSGNLHHAPQRNLQ